MASMQSMMPTQSSYSLGRGIDTYNRGVDMKTHASELIKFLESSHPKMGSFTQPSGVVSGNIGRNKEKETLDDMIEGMTNTIGETLTHAVLISASWVYALLPVQTTEYHSVMKMTTKFEPKFATPQAPRSKPRLLDVKKVKGEWGLTRKAIGFELDLETLHVGQGSRWFAEKLIQLADSVEMTNQFAILWCIMTCHSQARVYMRDYQFVVAIGIPGLYERARRNFGHAQKHPTPVAHALRLLKEDAAKRRVPDKGIAVLLPRKTMAKLAETKDMYNKFYNIGSLAIDAMTQGGSAIQRLMQGATIYDVETFYSDSGDELDLMRQIAGIGLYYMGLSPYSNAGPSASRNAASRDMRVMDFRQRRKVEIKFAAAIEATDRYDAVTGAVNKFTAKNNWASLDTSLRDDPREDMFLYDDDRTGKPKPVEYWGQMRTDLWSVRDTVDLAGSMAAQLDSTMHSRYSDALNTLFEAAQVSEGSVGAPDVYFQWLRAVAFVNKEKTVHAAGSWGGVAPIGNIAEATRNETTRGIVLPANVLNADGNAIDGIETSSFSAWELPPGIANTGSGLEEIKRLYDKNPVDTVKYGISATWGKRISEAVPNLKLLAQKLNTEFGNNLLTNTKYAPSWMYKPTPFDVMVYTLLRERPVLWLNVTPKETQFSDGIKTVSFVKAVLQQVAGARVTAPNPSVAYDYLGEISRGTLDTPAGRRAYYEVLSKQSLLATFLGTIRSGSQKAKSGAAVAPASYASLLLAQANLAASFPAAELVGGGIAASANDATATLKAIVTSNPAFFVSDADAINAELDRALANFDQNQRDVLAEAVAPNKTKTQTDAGMLRSTVTVSPDQLRQLSALVSEKGVVALPSNPSLLDRYLSVSELQRLVEELDLGTRRVPLVLQPMQIRATVDSQSNDFGAAHRVATIRKSVQQIDASASDESAASSAAAASSAPQFASLVSNPFAPQAPVGAGIDARGAQVAVQRPAWKQRDSRRDVGGGGGGFGGAPSEPRAPRAPVNQQLRSLDAAVADLVNDNFAARYNGLFEMAMDKLHIAFGLALITTPNNYKLSIQRWLAQGYDVPLNVVLLRDLYCYAFSMVRMVAGAQTGGFLQGQENTWFGAGADRGIFGLYYSYYSSPYVHAPENIQKFDGFDLDGYAFGGGTGFRSGHAFAEEPNKNNTDGRDLLAVLLPPSVKELDAVWSPSGRLEVVSRDQYQNAPVVDLRFVNATFEQWRLKLRWRQQRRDINDEDIMGLIIDPEVITPAYYEDHTEYKDSTGLEYRAYRPARGPWPSSAVEENMVDALNGLKSFASVTTYDAWNTK